MDERICTVDGCELPRPYRLYCNGHYRRWRRTGDPGPANLKRPMPKGSRCVFDGCMKPARSAGLCGGHYLQWWNGRRLRPLRRQLDTTQIDANGRKLCSRCEVRQPVSEFHQNKQIRGGLSSHCKRCERSEVLLRNYGITVDQYEAILAEQGGACAICGEANSNGRNLYVDHGHRCCPGRKSCGACVRGILCDPCNRAIGLMRDDPERLSRAAAYVREKPTDG